MRWETKEEIETEIEGGTRIGIGTATVTRIEGREIGTGIGIGIEGLASETKIGIGIGIGVMEEIETGATVEIETEIDEAAVTSATTRTETGTGVAASIVIEIMIKKRTPIRGSELGHRARNSQQQQMEQTHKRLHRPEEGAARVGRRCPWSRRPSLFVRPLPGPPPAGGWTTVMKSLSDR